MCYTECEGTGEVEAGLTASTKCYETFKELDPPGTGMGGKMGKQKRKEAVCILGHLLVTLVVAVLVAMFVSVLVVAVAAVLVFGAAHAERLLDGHLLPA